MAAEPKDKGLSYVPQIKEAYDAMTKADGNALDAKLKLGQLLNDAKDAVGHGNFKHYLGLYCPYISHRSANDYMKLADNREKLADIRSALRISTDGDLSIRAALREIRTPEQKQAAADSAAKAKATRETNKTAALAAVAPPPHPTDEDKARRYIEALELDELYILLRGIFPEGRLYDLADAILNNGKVSQQPAEEAHVA